jgi:hypothetical protein
MEVCLALCYILRGNCPCNAVPETGGSRNLGRRIFQKLSCLKPCLKD